MFHEHPNISKRDWRLRGITTTAEEFADGLGTTHPVGTVVELVGFVQLPHGTVLSIPVPDPAAVYLSLARAAMKNGLAYVESELPNQILTVNAESRLANDSEQGFFDCLQSIVSGVVFSYTAIEAFANSVIPDDFVFVKPRQDKRCTEHYTKEQIERHVSLDVKLDEVLPKILMGAKSPKGGKAWSDYTKLQKTRDRLIHLKSEDWQKASRDKAGDWLWTILLSKPTRDSVSHAFNIINHFCASEPKRWRWSQKFTHS